MLNANINLIVKLDFQWYVSVLQLKLRETETINLKYNRSLVYKFATKPFVFKEKFHLQSRYFGVNSDIKYLFFGTAM